MDPMMAQILMSCLLTQRYPDKDGPQQNVTEGLFAIAQAIAGLAATLKEAVDAEAEYKVDPMVPGSGKRRSAG